MRSTQLMDGLTFHDDNPYAEPLFVDKAGRILRFHLRPGQSIAEHDAPHSPFYAVVLKGSGQFSGADGAWAHFGTGSLIIFDPGEIHAVRALEEELVFVGFLQGAPHVRDEKVGGELGRAEQE